MVGKALPIATGRKNSTSHWLGYSLSPFLPSTPPPLSPIGYANITGRLLEFPLFDENFYMCRNEKIGLLGFWEGYENWRDHKDVEFLKSGLIQVSWHPVCCFNIKMSLILKQQTGCQEAWILNLELPWLAMWPLMSHLPGLQCLHLEKCMNQMMTRKQQTNTHITMYYNVRWW